METQAPRALIVYESMFGNTATVAAAIADGLRELRYAVAICDVAWAPCSPLDADLLVIGAPTHAFSLSRPSTRSDAVHRARPYAGASGCGSG